VRGAAVLEVLESRARCRRPACWQEGGGGCVGHFRGARRRSEPVTPAARPTARRSCSVAEAHVDALADLQADPDEGRRARAPAKTRTCSSRPVTAYTIARENARDGDERRDRRATTPLSRVARHVGRVDRPAGAEDGRDRAAHDAGGMPTASRCACERGIEDSVDPSATAKAPSARRRYRSGTPSARDADDEADEHPRQRRLQLRLRHVLAVRADQRRAHESSRHHRHQVGHRQEVREDRHRDRGRAEPDRPKTVYARRSRAAPPSRARARGSRRRSSARMVLLVQRLQALAATCV
jgi:hypothetical protein